jgi:hypothetical protein
MRKSLAILAVAVAVVGASAQPLRADVITDWDAKAVAIVTPRMPPPATERAMAMVHIAMFDTLNSIERRYRPYLAQLPAAKTTSREAGVASAATLVLAALVPEAAAELKAALASYLATLPDDQARSDGVRLGEAVAAMVLEARSLDGARAADSYRPMTRPGIYVPTAATVLPMWPGVKPFAMTSAAQFRPEPPISLKSPQWAIDYNEIKDYGGSTSTRRSARQTEDARFWFVTGAASLHPLARQLVEAHKMPLIDSARFMTLVSIAAADAYIAVMDAKYHHAFWRPITAIRNGDADDNPATERDATWQPLGTTPMHPEYPCAHCIHSMAFAAVAEAILGQPDVPELVMTSPTAPGVTHRWSNLAAYTKEVAEARIWAGFHYRFSNRIGHDMGRKIAHHVVTTILQPVN